MARPMLLSELPWSDGHFYKDNETSVERADLPEGHIFLRARNYSKYDVWVAPLSEGIGWRFDLDPLTAQALLFKLTGA